MLFLDFFYFFTFLNFLNFFLDFLDFFIILLFSGFLSKLLRLLLKVTKVTTGHQKLPITGQNSIISSFFAPAPAKGRSHLQELEVGCIF